MSLNNKTAENSIFRKRQSITMAGNAAIHDPKLSLKAKRLYTLIMSSCRDSNQGFSDGALPGERTRLQQRQGQTEKPRLLKVHFIPSGENNRWCVEYELLDVADPADGVHTYYYNLAGEVTATNLTRKAQRDNAEPAPEQQADSCPPQNVGDNIILPSNTKNNTQDNHAHSAREQRRDSG